MNRRPAFQFYPADWRKDSALQSCSIAARGLWMDLLCIMHECTPYGSLTINGQPLQVSQIARLVGETVKTLLPLLNELEEAGVFSRDADGTIFSRRMRRDEHIRNIRAEAGKLGGNPLLLNQMDKQKDNLIANQTGQQKPTPSSSSSFSSSLKDTYATSFDTFWKLYPSRNGKKVEKEATYKRFCALKEMEIPLILRAVKNYAESSDVKQGIGIKDPKRFIRNKDGEYWREWIVPEQKTEQHSKKEVRLAEQYPTL